MNLSEIKQAIEKGHKVFWKNPNYLVIKNFDQYLIKCLANGYCIGLTWMDGKTLNGNEKDFYQEVEK
jgi:hypothetical protein